MTMCVICGIHSNELKPNEQFNYVDADGNQTSNLSDDPVCNECMDFIGDQK